MKSVTKLVALSVLLLASGCAAVAEAGADAKAMMAENASAAETISMAKNRYAEASKKGCAWRDTGKMIKNAEKLNAEGKQEKAQSVAARAMRQAEMGLKQCEM